MAFLRSHLEIFDLVLTLASPPPGTTAAHVEVERYDPYSNTWNVTCPALKYVSNFTATACHGKLYVIGSCAVKYNALTMQCYSPVTGEDETSTLNWLALSQHGAS